MTLSGMREVREEEPVCHGSIFEDDTFSRWRGKCLSAKAAWDYAASSEVLEATSMSRGVFSSGGFSTTP